MNMTKSSRLLTWRQVAWVPAPEEPGRAHARRVLGETPAQKDCRFYWECDARRRHSPLPIHLERRHRHIPSQRADL